MSPTRKSQLTRRQVKELLDEHVALYNRPAFIEDDPISIPHLFTRLQDIEISGLFAAVLAWGQRKTIVRKCSELIERMDGVPHEFVLHHQTPDLKRLETFVHRTFNGTDVLYFVAFLRWFYERNESLEQAFAVGPEDHTTEESLIRFNRLFFHLPFAPQRTRKHVATPERGSACKRLNMYLRWMVRKDDAGVDFGLWRSVSMSQLVCPCDVHVERVARRLGLIKRNKADWQTALELTHELRTFDPEDPVRYDFALFGLGVMNR